MVTNDQIMNGMLTHVEIQRRQCCLSLIGRKHSLLDIDIVLRLLPSTSELVTSIFCCSSHDSR